MSTVARQPQEELGGQSRSVAPRRPLRVLYAAGPGDVVGTFRHWQAGRSDPTQVSATYSGQFFDACRAEGVQAVVVGCGPRAAPVREEGFELLSRPVPFANSRKAMLYHLGQWSYGLWLWWMSVRHRVDLAVISQGTHWHMLALMAVCGVRVVPSIHTSFWPRGHRRSSPGRRLVWRLDRWFWNRGAWATLALSSEIQRQLGEIAGQGRGPVLRWRLRFPSGLFERLPPADHAARPFRILYGGRLVRTKGVFEMLDVADRLERQRPGGFAFEMCGEGEDAPDLRRLAADRGLQHVFELPGQLGRSELLAALGRCHAVVVPTTAAMTEGFARSAAEAVMARRPVVVSSVVPAVEDLAGAAVEVAASDIEGYVRAFQRLADDPAYYAGLVHGCQSARGQFERAGRSWGDAVRLLFRAAREARPAAWALEEFARA